MWLFFFRFKNASKILLWSYTGAVVTHPSVIHSRHLLPNAPEYLRKHSYSSWWALPLTKDVFCKYFLPSSSNPAASCLKVAVLNTWADVSQSMAVSPITGRISTLLLELLSKMQGIKLSKRFSSKKPDDFMERSCPVSKLSCAGQSRGLNPARCDGSQQQLRINSAWARCVLFNCKMDRRDLTHLCG